MFLAALEWLVCCSTSQLLQLLVGVVNDITKLVLGAGILSEVLKDFSQFPIFGILILKHRSQLSQSGVLSGLRKSTIECLTWEASLRWCPLGWLTITKLLLVRGQTLGQRTSKIDRCRGYWLRRNLLTILVL